MKRVFLSFILFIMVVACGPDIEPLPDDYYFSISNQTDSELRVTMSYKINYINDSPTTVQQTVDTVLSRGESTVFIILKNVDSHSFNQGGKSHFYDLFSEGNVKVYDTGTNQLLVEWDYSERDNPGKQLFSYDCVAESKTGHSVELEFSITSQDLY